MATKIELQNVAKRTYYTSKAYCDCCGAVGGDTYMGQVTAPLPTGWKCTAVAAGKFTKMGYACTSCQ